MRLLRIELLDNGMRIEGLRRYVDMVSVLFLVPMHFVQILGDFLCSSATPVSDIYCRLLT